jgi:large subunit ribosomal protein L21
MYAVIRTGGKQYRVAPGDVIRVEKLAPAEGDFQFDDVLAISSDEGKVGAGSGAKVSARVLGDGRGDKILVFHYKRKKQYKKLQGHRQAFTDVQITEINVDGQSFKADAAKLRQPAKPKAEAAEGVQAAAAKKKSAGKKSAKKAATKKSAAKKSAPKKK